MFLVLVSAQPAGAHLDVRPGLLEQGSVTELQIELPQLRPGPAPVRLQLAGPGIEVLSTRLVGARGPESAWTARVRATAPPGRLAIVLRAVYADGKSVEVDAALTVVPGSERSSFPWVGAAAGALLAVAFAAVALLVARRKA